MSAQYIEEEHGRHAEERASVLECACPLALSGGKRPLAMENVRGEKDSPRVLQKAAEGCRVSKSASIQLHGRASRAASPRLLNGIEVKPNLLQSG
jgi:hypothetical protein